MTKKIFSVGYDIPGDQTEYINFSSDKSLMDADIIVISPDIIKPSGDWVSFSAGGGCYNIDPSTIYRKQISRLKKEIEDHLKNGRSVFILLTEEEKYTQRIMSPRQEKGNTITILRHAPIMISCRSTLAI